MTARRDRYELHARRFLTRLQRLASDLHSPGVALDDLVPRAAKWWPQILGAFRWACRMRASSPAAEAIFEALTACAEGDIAQLQFRRTATDLKSWSAATARYAQQRVENPNDAAFLHRFADIAMVQSDIFEIAETTRMKVHDVLGREPAGTPLQPESGEG